MASTDLSSQRLCELLQYDPATGSLIWKARPRQDFESTRAFNTWNARYAGKSAGWTSGRYVYVSIAKQPCLAHRIAWAVSYGAWPTGVIDHINGDKRDNRLANLRDVSGRINNENQRSAGTRKRSGLPLGVFNVPQTKAIRYRACIVVQKKQIRLGCFDTPEEAHAAYLLAKRRLHEGCTI